MTRTIWVNAHPRRLPDRTNTKPHQELWEAYRSDQLNREIAEQIAAEVERDLRQEARS